MGLCHRCGAILDDDQPPGRYRGECPSCGLGYSGTRFGLERVAGLRAAPLKVSDEARRRAQAVRERRDTDLRQAVARCPFPVFGLDDSWSGRRWISGWGGSGDNVDHLELAHGDVYDPDAPVVRIETRWTTADPEGDVNTFEPHVRRVVARALVERLWHETGTYLDATSSTFQGEDPTGQWDVLRLDVDNEPRRFSALQVGTQWVALATVGRAVLGLQVRNIPPSEMKLVSIDHPTEYLDDDGAPR
jgi:hypothetical protein